MMRRLLDVSAGGLGGLTLAGIASSYWQRPAPPPPSSPAASSTPELPKQAQGDAKQRDLVARIEQARLVFPLGLPSTENLRVFSDYCSSVNYRTRIPNWVAEVTAMDAAPSVPQ